MKKISITLDGIDFYKFKKHCAKNGFKVSTRINILINKDVDRNKCRLP